MTLATALIILSPFLFACIPALIWHDHARRLAAGESKTFQRNNRNQNHRAPSTGEGDAPLSVAPFAGSGALQREADHAA